MVDVSAWQTGAYRDMAFSMLPIVSRLVARADVRPGERVLDVGCGTGTVSILAAQRGARLTGLDITPRMLELAREDARLAGVELTLQEGDAQKMPFPDASFDVVLSNMGLIFAPDAERAADEMLRVLRPGGRLAFTAWTRGHAMGALHEALDTAAGAREPGGPHLRWGERAFVETRLAAGTRGLLVEHDVLERPALSVAHVFEFMSRAAPPVVQALAALPPEGQARLRALFLERLAPFVRDGLMRAEYVRVTATRA